MNDRIKRWNKDGSWHITEKHEPTAEERKSYPVSYPPGDSGPFYRWTAETYRTEAEAKQALEKLDN